MRLRQLGAGLLIFAALGSGCDEGEVLPEVETENGVVTPRVAYPLDGPLPNGFALKRSNGATLTNGQLTVTNLGERPLRILSVDPETDSGLEYLGARLASPSRAVALTQVFDAWPPTDPALGPLQAVPGAVLEPGGKSRTMGYEVLLGFKIVKEGRSTVKSVKIRYMDGDEEQQVTFTSTLALCTDVPTSNDCVPEYDE